MGEYALAERLESKLAKYGPKRQDQMTKTLESIFKRITNCNWLNRDSQIINTMP